MSFFGLTSLGGGGVNPFHDGSAFNKFYSFHDTPDDLYLETFKEHALGDCLLANQLQVDGSQTILRSHLGHVLKRALGRHPSKMELDTWLTFLDFETRSTMGLDEFKVGLRALKDFSAQPDSPAKYRSFDTQRLDWVKHRRVEYDPQKTLKGPITTSQEIGWHSLKDPASGREDYFPRRGTDVTFNEGRGLADYYGHIVMM